MRVCLLLAGGASTRMGRDKASLVYQGKSLLRLVGEAALPLVEQLWVVLSPTQPSALRAELPDPKVRWLTDPKPHLGPMYALAQAVPALELHSQTVLVLSCDLPFLTPAFLEELFALQETSQTATAPEAPLCIAAAQNGPYPNPLLAVYPAQTLTQAPELWAKGRQDAKALLEGANLVTLQDRPEGRGVNRAGDWGEEAES